MTMCAMGGEAHRLQNDAGDDGGVGECFGKVEHAGTEGRVDDGKGRPDAVVKVDHGAARRGREEYDDKKMTVWTITESTRRGERSRRCTQCCRALRAALGMRSEPMLSASNLA
jgi:hypothetical protein